MRHVHGKLRTNGTTKVDVKAGKTLSSLEKGRLDV
jgi:hypothetical protein